MPLFPVFSRLAAKGDLEGIREYFNKGVGTLFLIGIPIMVFLFVLGQTCVSLVFERGAFDSRATFMVTEGLWFLSVSILPYVFRDCITRVYYSFNDAKTPFVVAFASIILKFALNWVFISVMGWGIGGITLSTSLVTLVNACVLAVLVRRHISLRYWRLLGNLGKMLGAGMFTLAAGFAAAALPLAAVPKILAAGAVMAIVYLGLNLVFKTEYLLAFKGRLKW